MTCDKGNHLGRDYCYEVCGDGRNAGFLGCDDSNRVSGDGCDKNCKLE
jgi:cysteine-rich repeat protein